jgi:hypothetical protein
VMSVTSLNPLPCIIGTFDFTGYGDGRLSRSPFFPDPLVIARRTRGFPILASD